MDPLWESSCADAMNHPGACNATCGSPRGPMTCQNGTPQVPPGPGHWRPPWMPARPQWWPRDFYWRTHRPGLTCAEPRALTCALRNGQGGPVPTTNGAVINHNGSLYFRPACGACQSMGNMNPGLIQWVNRPALWLPTDIGLGMCPSQTFNGSLGPFDPPGRPFRPGGGLGRPGLGGGGPGLGGGGPGFGGGGMLAVGPDGELFFVGDDPRDRMGVCPRPGNLGNGGGVDPPFEGESEDQAVGCGCSGSGAAPLSGLTLACGALYLLAPRRRRRARRP